jgi:mannose-6-phosphate isomerase-like protein (cupin superfamily)
MIAEKPKLEILDHDGPGYKPLVFSDGWQTAILNWEPTAALDQASEIEIHQETDEVFVLWRGRGALYVITEGGLQVVDLKPGVIYNVCRGTWHGVIATTDVSWIIIENRDTHLHDCEIRQLTVEEKNRIRSQAPQWAG